MYRHHHVAYTGTDPGQLRAQNRTSATRNVSSARGNVPAPPKPSAGGACLAIAPDCSPRNPESVTKNHIKLTKSGCAKLCGHDRWNPVGENRENAVLFCSTFYYLENSSKEFQNYISNLKFMLYENKQFVFQF